MKPEQIYESLKQFGNGMAQVSGIIASTDYACPTRDWLENVFGPALKRDLERFKASTYTLSRNDCTNFSLYAMALARLSHNLSNDNKTEMAYGTIDYMHSVPEGIPEGHRTNIVILFENGVYVPVFFEPQIQKIVTPTSDEKDSVRGYYI